MYCMKCGALNDDNNHKCTSCGSILHHVQQSLPKQVVLDDSLSSVIPYKNSASLVAYYVGLFSFIPFIGIVMGVIAVVYGIKALNHVKSFPESKGKVHAVLGIVFGILFGALSLLLSIGILAAIISHN